MVETYSACYMSLDKLLNFSELLFSCPQNEIVFGNSTQVALGVNNLPASVGEVDLTAGSGMIPWRGK